MSDDGGNDLLMRATHALRDQGAAPDGGADADGPWQLMAGWSGVVRELRRRTRRRRVLMIGGLQVLLALAGLGAWAAVAGRLPALFERRPTTEAPAPAPRKHAGRRAPAPPAPAVLAPVNPAPITPAPAPPRSRPRAAVSAESRLAARAPAPDDLYEQAHQAHFARRDYAAALAAWDRYLALGECTFTLEARYNRAIALVRLGRRAEAAAALRPFASGEHGAYRADQARALLRKLDVSPDDGTTQGEGR